MHRHNIYGLVVAASRPLPAGRAEAPADIVIREHSSRRPSRLPPNPRGYSYDQLENGDIHVSWSELFDFVVSADGSFIDVYCGSATDVEPVYTYLISQVISVALLQKGIESLHASAVAIGGKAIVLVGDSGYGKSTLTGALLAAGAQLVTDDLLVLTERGDGYDAAPGACRLKLDPDTARALGVQWQGVPMADGSGKFVYLPSEDQCVNRAVPVGRVLLIEPYAAQPSVEPVTTAEATRAILAATFNPLHTERPRLARLLHDAQKIARGTRIERLHVPRALNRINEVVSLI